MRATLYPVAAVAAGLLVSGCQTAKVTLLNNEDGKSVGAVAVLDPKTGVNLGKVERKIGACKLVSISERMSLSKLALDGSQTAKIGDVCRRAK